MRGHNNIDNLFFVFYYEKKSEMRNTMALELRQLLEKVSELDITPIAGQAGLERRVRWVHMVENEDSTTFLEGQDIAVITGIGLGESLTLMNLIRTLRGSHASGVIVNLGPYIQQIPQDVIEYCDQYALPLFTIPWKQHVAQLIRIFSRAISLADLKELAINTAFQNAIFSPERKELYEISLTERGIKPDFSFHVCSVYFSESSHDFSFLESTSLHLQIALEQLQYQNYAIFPYDDVILIICWNWEKETIKSLAKDISHILNKYLHQKKDWYIGIGKRTGSLSCLHKSYNQAIEIQNLQYRHIIPRDHYYFEELGVYYLLMSIDSKEVLSDYYQKTLAPLISHDSAKEIQLLELLKYYLENNGSVQKTAEHFYVHRNSVNYRLNQIQELLDVNLSDLDTRIQLKLAFMVRDMLD